MQSILGNTRKTDLTFRANGQIDITARVADMLALKKGDVIDILTDSHGVGELYLYVRMHAPTVGHHKAACFPSHQPFRHFRAWSKKLCLYVIRAGGSSLDRVDLGVGTPVDLPGVGTAIPIIYRHILNDDTRD